MPSRTAVLYQRGLFRISLSYRNSSPRSSKSGVSGTVEGQAEAEAEADTEAEMTLRGMGGKQDDGLVSKSPVT